MANNEIKKDVPDKRDGTFSEQTRRTPVKDAEPKPVRDTIPPPKPQEPKK